MIKRRVHVFAYNPKSIDMWSSENAGHVDINCELELWTRAGHVKVHLKKGVDVRKLDRLIAAYVM